ncbi:hypothetical protein RN22_09005 [Grimontia sp. AD028]|uniref:hypothetical protein n=1 Tax=Grimontia sp. AD028 TaxID=1581149 RepID=UPI00061ADF61|nr:hypothetical protein [Grimontia sp. AD028]KKD60870.1 hypothetical protein RN22_09005 [Grimontia sp. AD028]
MERYDDQDFIRMFAKDPVAFFKGEDGFFFRQPDWGVHMYYRSMSVFFRRIKNNDISLQEFEHGFELFINSLGVGSEDFEHFESNICAFYQCMIDDKEPVPDFFEIGRSCRISAERYLSLVSLDYSNNHYYQVVKTKYSQAAINEIW